MIERMSLPPDLIERIETDAARLGVRPDELANALIAVALPLVVSDLLAPCLRPLLSADASFAYARPLGLAPSASTS